VAIWLTTLVTVLTVVVRSCIWAGPDVNPYPANVENMVSS